MNEQHLLKIAFLISVTGIMILYGVAHSVTPPEHFEIGEEVRLYGRIENIQNTPKTARFDLVYDARLPVVLFKDSEIELEEGEVTIEGLLEDEQLIAYKIDRR